MPYLIVWGASAHAVRAANGSEQQAAMEAFGNYDASRMSFSKVAASTMYSDTKRTKAIHDLLAAHRVRFRDDFEIVTNSTREIRELERHWAAAWDSLERRRRARKEATV